MYRQGRNYENLNKSIFNGVGEYDIPSLLSENITTDDFIGFNYAKTCRNPYDKGLHFFIDDYQFTRLWSNPDAYLDLISKFRCVCTPDFSTYTDFPKAIQIYNHYRKHWLGAYWQQNGITVIPTISWSDKSSLDWCFDGEPTESTIAVSSVGTQISRESKDLFLTGYKEMLNRLHPTTILFYGGIPNECKADNVIHLSPFQESVRKRCKKEQNNGR